jgi:hypothetical protein
MKRDISIVDYTAIQGRQFRQDIVLARKVTKVWIDSDDERSKVARERELLTWSRSNNFILSGVLNTHNSSVLNTTLVQQLVFYNFFLIFNLIYLCIVFRTN